MKRFSDFKLRKLDFKSRKSVFTVGSVKSPKRRLIYKYKYTLFHKSFIPSAIRRKQNTIGTSI